ncbi:MAG: hypothetical protein J6M60_00215 [Clostridia bacterium]|nr:hypothetical protein [Clostridia bacterium]
MLDLKNYVLLENKGYEEKADAYEHIRLWYSHLKGVTTYFSNGRWFIVQSLALA